MVRPEARPCCRRGGYRFPFPVGNYYGSAFDTPPSSALGFYNICTNAGRRAAVGLDLPGVPCDGVHMQVCQNFLRGFLAVSILVLSAELVCLDTAIAKVEGGSNGLSVGL